MCIYISLFLTCNLLLEAQITIVMHPGTYLMMNKERKCNVLVCLVGGSFEINFSESNLKKKKRFLYCFHK